MASKKDPYPYVKSFEVATKVLRAHFEDEKLHRDGMVHYVYKDDELIRRVRTLSEGVIPTWKLFLDAHMLRGEAHTITTAGLTRMTLLDGPGNPPDWLRAMNMVLIRLQKTLNVPIEECVHLVRHLTNLGWADQSSTDLCALMTSLLATQSGPNEPRRPSLEGLSDRPRKVLGALGAAIRIYEGPVQEGNLLPSKLLHPHPAFTHLPCAVNLFLATGADSLFAQFEQEGILYDLYDFWVIIDRCHALGLDTATITRVHRRIDIHVGFYVLCHFARSVITLPTIKAFLREPDIFIFGVGCFEDLEASTLILETHGHPLTLEEFYAIGGTIEDLKALEDLAVEELEQVPSKGLVCVMYTKPAIDQTPKGTKRRHHNYRASDEEPTDVDFAAMCSELEVSRSFPELNSELTAILLVHGLLQEGSRLASMSALPARDQAKIWQQVKGQVSLSSAKTLRRPLRKLTDAHLVTYKKGLYQLSRPNPRFPQAHTLLTQLRALVMKYTP